MRKHYDFTNAVKGKYARRIRIPGKPQPKPKLEQIDRRKLGQRIVDIIENVDNRCMAADGDVTPTILEITTTEMVEIYKTALLIAEDETT